MIIPTPFLQLSLGILILLNTACKEKTEIEAEIIYPSPYFPVYPGSHWTYLFNDSDTLISSTAPEYILVSYKNPNGNMENYSVPMLDGEPVFKYQKLCHKTYNTDYYYSYTFFSDEVGKEFEQCYDGDPHYPHPIKISVVQKTVDANQDSLVTIAERNRFIAVITYRNYVINKGLTSEICIDTSNGDTVSKKVLIDFAINH